MDSPNEDATIAKRRPPGGPSGAFEFFEEEDVAEESHKDVTIRRRKNPSRACKKTTSEEATIRSPDAPRRNDSSISNFERMMNSGAGDDVNTSRTSDAGFCSGEEFEADIVSVKGDGDFEYQEQRYSYEYAESVASQQTTDTAYTRTRSSRASSRRFKGHGSYLNDAKREGHAQEFYNPKGFADTSGKEAVPSAAFKSGNVSRSKWVESDSKRHGPQRTGDLRTAFSSNKARNTDFKSKVSRFDDHGSYIKDQAAFGTGHHTIGHVDKATELEQSMGCLSMDDKARHRRLSDQGSIYAKAGEGRGGIGLAHGSIVKDIFASASDSGPSAAFFAPTDDKNASRAKWMHNKDQDDRASQKLPDARTDFDSGKAAASNAVFKDSSGRFEGQNSYIKQGEGAKVAGLAHEDALNQVQKIGGLRMDRRHRHGRFSNAHAIFKKAQTDHIGLGHESLGDSNLTQGSASFRSTEKAEARTKWLDTAPESQKLGLADDRTTFDSNKMTNAVKFDSSNTERFKGVNSHFTTPKHISKHLGGTRDDGMAKEVERKAGGGGVRMVKSRRSRFSMAGGIHSKIKQKSQSIGLSHSPMGKPSRSGSISSPAFKSGSSSSRSSWMKNKAPPSYSGTSLSTVSEFDSNNLNKSKTPSAVFKTSTDRFKSAGSYLTAKASYSGPSRTHGSLIKKTGPKMVKTNKKRFSMAGSIYKKSKDSGLLKVGLSHNDHQNSISRIKSPAQVSAAFAGRPSSEKRAKWLKSPATSRFGSRSTFDESSRKLQFRPRKNGKGVENSSSVANVKKTKRDIKNAMRQRRNKSEISRSPAWGGMPTTTPSNAIN